MSWQLLTYETLTAGTMPAILFIENVGQFPETVRYHAQTAQGNLWITNDGYWLDDKFVPIRNQTLTPLQQLETKISYYQGQRSNMWFQDVPVWSGIRFHSALAGMDWVISGRDGTLKGEYWVGDTVLKMPAFLQAEIATSGFHILKRQPSPEPVEGRGGDDFDYEQTFALNLRQSTLKFSTFIGSNLSDEGNDIALDDVGNIYLTGFTTSLSLPLPLSPHQPQHGVDVFIAKIRADGSALDYLIHVNPPTLNAEDYGYGIAVDNEGAAYVTGATHSAEFPVTPGAYDETYHGNGDIFLLKVAPDGGSFEFSTFIGGSDFDTAQDIALDYFGNILLTGGTWSTDFVTNTLGTASQRDIYVLKMNPDGSQLLQNMRIAGNLQEEGKSIAVACSGETFITGWTFSNDLPITPNALDTSHNGGPDGFVYKLDLNHSSISFGTYLGGSEEDRAAALALNEQGEIFVTGMTRSPDFVTTTNAYQPVFSGGMCAFETCPDAFVTKLSADGTTALYSTYLGGSSEERAEAIALFENKVIVTGQTWSTDFPTTTLAIRSHSVGGREAFVTQLNTVGENLLYSSYLGGSEWERGLAVAADSVGDLIVTGFSNSPDFHSTSGAYDTSYNGENDIFVLKLNPGVHNQAVRTGVNNFTCVPSPPKNTVDPMALMFMQTGSINTMTHTLTISNTGGSVLDWMIAEAAATCSSLEDLTWVSTNPIMGTTDLFNAAPVDIVFAAEGLPASIYTGTICINSNDPIFPQISIPITLTTNTNYIYLPVMTSP